MVKSIFKKLTDEQRKELISRSIINHAFFMYLIFMELSLTYKVGSFGHPNKFVNKFRKKYDEKISLALNNSLENDFYYPDYIKNYSVELKKAINMNYILMPNLELCYTPGDSKRLFDYYSQQLKKKKNHTFFKFIKRNNLKDSKRALKSK